MRFDLKADFRSVNFDGYSWFFLFEGHIAVRYGGGLWRYRVGRRIRYVSSDHLHQFGLPAPLNVESEMRELLSPRALTAITADEVTGDLLLEFDDRSLVEMFTSSTGYESWDLEVGGQRYICMGGGQIYLTTGT